MVLRYILINQLYMIKKEKNILCFQTRHIKSVKYLVAELEKHQYIKSYTMKKKLQQHLMKNDNEDDVISLESDSL